MRGGSLTQALWQRHVNAVNAPLSVRGWLTGTGSLTAKLQGQSGNFRVRRLHQGSAICLFDEAALIGLRRPGRVWEREVVLTCDEQAVVFAHTVVPMAATAADWPQFGVLGERSLGSTLFGDRQVRRGELQYARLRCGHPLNLRALAALHSEEDQMLYARRCLYRRRQGLLLVTEVFLPAVAALSSHGQTDTLTNRTSK